MGSPRLESTPSSPAIAPAPARAGLFLGGSLALHGAVFGAALGGPTVLRAFRALLTTLALTRAPDAQPSALTGDSFEPPREAILIEAPATDPGEPAPSGGAQESQSTAQSAPGARGAEDGLEKPRPPPSRGGRTQARAASGPAGAPSPATSGASGESSEPAATALYGAVGERAALDLPLAFTRTFPQASSTDPAWASAPLGSAGVADILVTLAEDGHIESVSVTNADGALGSSVSRTLTLLRARPFTARGKTTRLHLSARVSPDQVHDGLHGDVFAIGQSFYGGEGSAFFALSIGRRIDVRVTAR